MGQDPTSGGGGNFLSSLSSVVDDAFKAYQISQTPTNYRAASPQSPAALQIQAQAAQSKSTSQMLLIGGIIAIILVLYLVLKK
jgi:hypothetical protein